jgi:hypothetical protein
MSIARIARVRRVWDGADELIGRLVHKRGGADHGRWVFDYDAKRTEDDDPVNLRDSP